MPTLKLTDRFCQTAKSDVAQTDYFDSQVKGLGLRVSSSGKRSWIFLYTSPTTGKRTRWTIAGYPDVGLASAREKGTNARTHLAEGHDPKIIAEQERAAGARKATVATLVESYLARKVATKRSVDEIARRLRKNVSGEDASGAKVERASAGCIGSIALDDLHRRDITRCVDAIKDRGAGTEANRVFEDLRAMVRWARGRGDLDENLMEGMQKPSEQKARDRVLSPDEIRTFWEALGSANMRDATKRVLKLCLLTGQRVGEVSGMSLDELEMNRMIWTIPKERSKNGEEHAVPLSQEALKLIREQMDANADLARRKKREAPRWVFPAPGGRGAMSGMAVAKAVKRQEVISDGVATIMGVRSFTPHDLRRSAATGMAQLRIPQLNIAHVLNHRSVTSATVTGEVYDHHDYMSEKREALEKWSSRVDAILKGKGAQILEFAAAK